jgi:hypothetical protein
MSERKPPEIWCIKSPDGALLPGSVSGSEGGAWQRRGRRREIEQLAAKALGFAAVRITLTELNEVFHA